jgi:A/G-specific adenine glycosylase
MAKTWRLARFARRTSGRCYHVRSWPYLPPRYVARLMAWSDVNRRSFPWRESKSPFAKLVGEMLLRKTSARHAQLAFTSLIDRWPTAESLANADREELARILHPLGMVRHRLEGLLEMARFLVERYRGHVPASPAELQRIPHVGRYTANAVCSFAFGLPLPIVDTNVVRVLHRFTGKGTTGPRAHTHDENWRRMTRSLPESCVDQFNYGLLDLGATVCRPTPHCDVCPLEKACAYAIQHKGARPKGLTPQS